jgi:hypothetical protein
MVYGFDAFFKFSSVLFQFSSRCELTIAVDCLLSLSTSQRLLSFIQVYVARPVRKITYVLLVFVVRPLSVDASLSPDY